MGNCCGGARKYEAFEVDENKMVQTWKATGILGLRDRRLKAMPGAVAAVGADAKVLDASNNQLSEWPSQLSSLTNLQRLVLASNAIPSIPGSALGPLAGSLKVLVLDGNALAALPDELGLLIRLEKLSLKANDLTQLNPCIGRLKQLQVLNVSANALRRLPPELAGCDAIEELDASSNQLTGIPTELGQCQKLKALVLDSNKITGVPPAVFLNCAALQTLSLHANPVVPDQIEETEGFQAFEKRRREKYNKVIAGGVLLGPRGMDEGIDRK